MNQGILNKLRGALELMLFMPGAEKAFRGTSFEGALRSFLVPIILLPYGIWAMTLTHDTELQDLSKLEGLRNFSTEFFILITFLKALFMTAFGLVVLYLFCIVMDRRQFFFDAISAGNWMAAPSILFSLPVILIILFGSHDWMAIYLVATIYILYQLAVSAFATSYVLNIPWELGTAYAIFWLAIGETTNKALHLIGTTYFA